MADNLLNGDTRSVNDRITCYGLFIDPPLGRLGMGEEEIRRSGRKALMGTRPMTRVGGRPRSQPECPWESDGDPHCPIANGDGIPPLR